MTKWTPKTVRDLLGTPYGDMALAHPSGPNALFEELVGNAERAAYGGRIKDTPEGQGVAKDKPVAPVVPPPPPAVKVESTRVEEVYSSREHRPGLGYPSCTRALARRAPTFKDNNGYYRYLRVLPTATVEEIRTKLRTLYRRCHSDGWAPDAAEFSYLREIAAVLLHPRRRDRYDNLDPGEKWLDSRVREELGDHDDAIVMDYVRKADRRAGAFRAVDPDPEVVKEAMANGGISAADRRQAMHEATAKNGYDYLANRLQSGDFQLAQLWYHWLVDVAPLFAYTRPIRVFLHDTDASWSDMGGILRIDRSWTPGQAEAFALFSVVVRGVSQR